jgi:hypothetical protein
VGSNFRILWRQGRQRLPLVQRDIKKFSAISGGMDDSLCSGGGRVARSDQVASCLLMREYEGAMPVRREVLVSRNRRRLKVIFIFTIVWWIIGWLLMM